MAVGRAGVMQSSAVRVDLRDQPAGGQRWSDVAIAVGLYLAAVAYFAIGIRSGIELSDTGMLLYPSWRVAHGAVPLRDFIHLFGPAGFALNAALLRWCGVDLMVIRVSLLVINGAIAVLTYLVARLAAGRPFALIAYALTVAVWGVPNWVSSIPYPNHCAIVLILMSLLVVIAWQRRFLVAWALAGTCCGVAATFKQTSGVFALLGLGLFLVWDPTTDAVPRLPGGTASARAVRALFLVGGFAMCVAYLWPANTVWNVVILFGPVAASFALLAGRELRGTVGAPERGAWGLIAAGAGFAVPIAAWTAYFAAHGALEALYAGAVGGSLPPVHWFEPLAQPPWRVLLLIGLVLAAAAALRCARTDESRLVRRLGAGSLMVLVVGVGTMLVEIVDWPESSWELIWGASLLPFLAVWGTLPLVFPELGAWLPQWARPAAVPASFALFASIGSMSLLFLYPSADFAHLLMGLPLFLPLVAMIAARWYRVSGATPRAGRAAAAVAIAAITALLAGPFVALLVRDAREPRLPATFARATGVHGTDARFEDAAELVRYLDVQAPELPLFILGNEQLLYFLSGRDSILPREEFVLYMLGFGTTTDDDARAFLPPDRIIERLTAARPLVVDYSDPRAAPFRRAYPEVASFLAAHYGVARVIGPYRVLGWAR